MNFFDLHFRDINGEGISFSRFKGKVCLVVNIASQCRFTSQLHEMEKLNQLYQGKGLVLFGFPSNDFKNQEPLTNEALQQFCKGGFAVSFHLFEKSHVKGKDVNDVFRFLTGKNHRNKIILKPLWNFQKYLVDRNGDVADFYFSFTRPMSKRLRKKIEQLL